MKRRLKVVGVGLGVFLCFPMLIPYRGVYVTTPPKKDAAYCSISLDFNNCVESKSLSVEAGGVHITNVAYALTFDKDTKAYFSGDIPNKEFSFTPTAAMLLPLVAAVLSMCIAQKRLRTDRKKTK
jgi:hypothetical protein